MTRVMFIRTTHENGRFRPFPTEAYQFWREQGWVVGEAFRLEQGIMFAEIVSRCEEYLLGHPDIRSVSKTFCYFARSWRQRLGTIAERWPDSTASCPAHPGRYG
jgi:hypothetical protein